MVECLAIARQLGERRLVGRASHRLGDLAFVFGEYGAAWAHYEAGVRIHQMLGDRHYLALGLDGLAGVATQQGQPRRAARLLGAAAALRDQVGPTAERSYEPLYDDFVARTRAALDEATFDTAWNAGRLLTPDAALAEARIALAPPPVIGPTPTRAPAANAPPTAEALTPREVEVLRLVAEGLSDVQVAERLFVSARTVHAHLRTIYGKLGVSSRGAATRWAVERGMV
jgi:DNA-binding CsgD family transcriptional regulator